MVINEYGNKKDPIVLLLAPMMVSGEDLYQLMHPYFYKEYHFIAPDQGGHGKAGSYINADEEYKTLRSFLLDSGYTEIELVYGAKTKAEASPSLVQMYGYDFAKMMTKNFERITVDDIDAICHACCHYDLRKLTIKEQKKLHLDFGEKDFDWKYSKKTIPVYMPQAELVIRQGFQHCAYMAAHPKEYVEEIESFIRR